MNYFYVIDSHRCIFFDAVNFKKNYDATDLLCGIYLRQRCRNFLTVALKSFECMTNQGNAKNDG